MATTKYNSALSSFHGHLSQEFFTSRHGKRNGGVKVSVKKAKLSEANVKRAKLSAGKKERVKLPKYCDGIGGDNIYHISKFFSHPSGIEAILNTRALQSCQSLDSNVYRCILPQIQLLNFEVAPVLNLQVTPTSSDCVVEMLSCKFEGSEVVERQNKHFTASMKNHIKWETVDGGPFLDVDVKLNLVLEIYTQPFTLLPVSAVEVPGNLTCKIEFHGTQNDASPSGSAGTIACTTAATRLRGMGSLYTARTPSTIVDTFVNF